MLEQKTHNNIEQGILLLAIGNPYYGRMAYNLAMSIKAIEPSTHITLIYTESAISHINHRNMWVFDNKIIAPYDESVGPFGTKLHIDQLTPYNRTIYIDADTCWINKSGPSKLFDQLKGIPFTGITEGMHDYKEPDKSDHSKHYFFWADVNEIKDVYEVGDKIYQWRSEFMYFENNEITKSLFADARDIYTNPDLKTIKMFADKIPDELAINITCCINNIHPHTYKWQPTYWDRLYGGNMPTIDALQTKYYVISCGSNASGGALKRVYDRVVSASAYKLKLQHVFPLISKKEMLVNRQLM